MCKLPRAEQVTGKMLHFQGVLETITLTNYSNFYLQNQMHLSTCLAYILSLSIIFFYIMHNLVIVIGTKMYRLGGELNNVVC